MIKSVFFYLLIPALVATSFMTGYTWHKAGTESELSDVIDWNTKQIHSLGVNSAVEKQNAELLIQILNVLEGNEVKSVSKAIPLGMMNSDEPIEDDDVPHTFEQVNKDQREVDRGIRAAASNNLFQNETLHNILEKLKGSII
jgi:hypothetical protein